VECGACIAVCPFHAIVSKDFATEEDLKKGKRIELENSFQIFFEEKCTSCSICVRSCPVVNWDINKAEEKIFGSLSNSPLGNFIEIWEAKAEDKEIFYNSQCGGVTTAIIQYMLDNRIVHCAIVTTEEDWEAKPLVAFNKRELLSSQKTKYSKSHILESFSVFSEELLNNYYVCVLTPCQMHGFYTMKFNTQRGKLLTKNAKLLIGTFCYGTYDTDKLLDYIEKKGISRMEITKMEIDTEYMRIYTKNGLMLEEHKNNIYPFLMNSCKYCHDLTNVIADISVGAIGTATDHTTVIIRTLRGKQIFDEAMKAGYISGHKVDAYHIEEIKKLSLEKIENGVKEILEKKTNFGQSVLTRTMGKIKKIFSRKKTSKRALLPDYIHSLYIVTDAGVPIYTYPYNENESVLISGIFGALNLLINSMSRGKQILKEVDFSEMKMLLEQREGFVVALLIKKENEKIRDIIAKFADELARNVIVLEKGIVKTKLNEDKLIKLITEYF